MRILIAEDDMISRRMLQIMLQKWGYDVVVAEDGGQAWEILKGENPPQLAILDWMMPVIDGVEICHKVRDELKSDSFYIILLTAKSETEDVVQGLDTGANDYVRKPFDKSELHARIRVGIRVIELQTALAERVRQLEEALREVKRLQGLIPICSYCKKIRDDNNYWQQVERYVETHSDAQFSHSICPDCYEKYVKPQLEELRQKKARGELGNLVVGNKEIS